MRALDRPPNPRVVPNYRHFLPDLIRAFGPFCSYCEHQTHGLDVEHVTPKSKDPALELAWDNLLLGCPRCNRDFKKNHNDDRAGYLWPDELPDTSMQFVYGPTGKIDVAEKVAADIAERAQRTITLCGLDRLDARQDREGAFRLATRQRKLFDQGRIVPEDIAEVARERGYWSIWMTVFVDVPAVRTALLDPANFPGTRR